MRPSAPGRARTLRDFAHYDFGGGINIQDSPQKLADTDLTSAVNVNLSTDGDLVQRLGVIATGSGAPAAPGFGARGLFRFVQRIVNGAVVGGPTGAGITQMIKQVGSTLYDATTGAMIGTAGQLGGGAQDMSCVQVFDPMHINGPTDILVICVGSAAGAGPFAYDGTQLYNFNAAPTNVAGARWCTVINATLWFGNVYGQPNLVVAAYVNQPENTPGYNTFAMSGPVTGLGVLGSGLQSSLAVGLPTGLSLISGFTPNSFTVNEVPMSDGVTGGRTMITVDGILYFVGDSGIYRYDGQSFTEISRKVRPWLLNDPRARDYPMNGDRTLSWAMYYNRRIYFWYVSLPTPTTTPQLATALVWDLLREGWTIYQSQIAFGAGCVVTAVPNASAPEQVQVVGQADAICYLFDYLNIGTDQVTDNGIPYVSSWMSKFFKIGDPGTAKRLLRIYPEVFATTLGTTFTITTDYGAQVNTLQLTARPFTWDAGMWDLFQWGTLVQAYYKKRFDVNIQGEAFAFGITNSALTPYRFMGLSGRFSQASKN